MFGRPAAARADVFVASRRASRTSRSLERHPRKPADVVEPALSRGGGGRRVRRRPDAARRPEGNVEWAAEPAPQEGRKRPPGEKSGSEAVRDGERIPGPLEWAGSAADSACSRRPTASRGDRPASRNAENGRTSAGSPFHRKLMGRRGRASAFLKQWYQAGRDGSPQHWRSVGATRSTRSRAVEPGGLERRRSDHQWTKRRGAALDGSRSSCQPPAALAAAASIARGSAAAPRLRPSPEMGGCAPVSAGGPRRWAPILHRHVVAARSSARVLLTFSGGGRLRPVRATVCLLGAC